MKNDWKYLIFYAVIFTLARIFHRGTISTTADWSEQKIDNIIASFKSFNTEARKALDEEDKNQASKIWRTLFGDRFDNNNKGNDINGPKHREVIITSKSWASC